MQLIYKNAALYTLVNRALYGRHHATRYRVIADLIPAHSSVVDLCSGPATLYHRFLRDKSIHYTGLDSSPFFIDTLNQRGGSGLLWDVRSEKPFPNADFVIIQGALYFFLPDPTALIDRMLAAATKQIIIAESIRNLSNSRIPFVGGIARRWAGAVQGNHPSRFTEETLDRLFDHYRSQLKQSFKIPGGRDKVYILEKVGASAALR